MLARLGVTRPLPCYLSREVELVHARMVSMLVVHGAVTLEPASHAPSARFRCVSLDSDDSTVGPARAARTLHAIHAILAAVRPPYNSCCHLCGWIERIPEGTQQNTIWKPELWRAYGTDEPYRFTPGIAASALQRRVSAAARGKRAAEIKTEPNTPHGRRPVR